MKTLPITKKTLLAATISSSLLAASQLAIAQDNVSQTSSQAVDEVITVKGIRSSLTQALGVKQTADSFVDAISAEDSAPSPE